MKIDLRKDANKGKCIGGTIFLAERLPIFVNQPISIDFNYSIQRFDEYYLISIEEKSSVQLICQRCSEAWVEEHAHTTELMICFNEKTAERLQNEYDVIVLPDLILDIKEVLLDNMHLFLPEKHENIDQCNQDQLKLLKNN